MNGHLVRALLLALFAVGAFIYTLAVGNEPLLGLDLQGGVSVVYQPTEEADEDALLQTTDIIRNRVDALGVAEPEISLQGQTIVVDLPGVDQQQRALDLVGQTAELRFRPVVLGPLPPEVLTPEIFGGSISPAVVACTDGLTLPENDNAEDYVLLAGDGGAYCLGPSELTGEALETAGISVGGQFGTEYQVNPVFRSGPTGIDAFNLIAGQCFSAAASCPNRTLAIVLDGEVLSAPAIQAASFDRDRINITGNFEEEEARDLSTALRFGALPVELEAQQTRTVSATIGSDVLRSGVTAGLIGLTLVAMYLMAYYRWAGLVAIGGLLISGLLLWSIISFVGETQGLAITLSGIVGLIVAIGVSADSNIVYFENVKDAVSTGRRVTTAVERAYRTSISTIIKADVVSLIAAVLLYLLTVGAVKGFAFYLGLATLLDLLVAVVFMRPVLAWMAGRPAVESNPKLLGLPIVESGRVGGGQQVSKRSAQKGGRK